MRDTLILFSLWKYCLQIFRLIYWCRAGFCLVQWDDFGCFIFMCRFWVDVEWNVRVLRWYASRSKHSQMKVCVCVLSRRLFGRAFWVNYSLNDCMVCISRCRESCWMGSKPSLNAESWNQGWFKAYSIHREVGSLFPYTVSNIFAEIFSKWSF